jgi:hypothetical protein
MQRSKQVAESSGRPEQLVVVKIYFKPRDSDPSGVAVVHFHFGAANPHWRWQLHMTSVWF